MIQYQSKKKSQNILYQKQIKKLKSIFIYYLIFYYFVISPKSDLPGPTDYNIKSPSPQPTSRVYRPFGCINCKGAGCELCRESILYIINICLID